MALLSVCKYQYCLNVGAFPDLSVLLSVGIFDSLFLTIIC
jgi:hypothetical protein